VCLSNGWLWAPVYPPMIYAVPGGGQKKGLLYGTLFSFHTPISYYISYLGAFPIVFIEFPFPRKAGAKDLAHS
jgi:hypothetical protein